MEWRIAAYHRAIVGRGECQLDKAKNLESGP